MGPAFRLTTDGPDGLTSNEHQYEHQLARINRMTRISGDPLFYETPNFESASDTDALQHLRYQCDPRFVYRQAARKGTTFFFLTTESSLFCSGSKFSITHAVARSVSSAPLRRPSLALMFSR